MRELAATTRPPMRLTKTKVRALPQAQSAYLVPDTVVPALAVFVQPAASKRWVVLTEDGSNEAQCSDIGSCHRVSVGHARALARNRLGSDSAVNEPDTERLQHTEFGAFVEVFLQQHGPSLRPCTYGGYKRSLRRSQKVFGGREIVSITPQEVARWSFAVAVKAPGTADTDKATMKSLFARAIQWGWLPTDHPNPAANIKRHARKPLANAFSTDELIRISNELSKATLRDLACAHLIWFMAYTGCRTGEAKQLRWDQVQTDRVVLPHGKTGPCELELSEGAQDILARRRELARPNDVQVFPHRHRRTGQPSKIDHPLRQYWNNVRKQARLGKKRRLYEMRHTFASQGVMIGLSDAQVSALLRHRNASSADRYVFLSDPHTQAVAEHVADRIADLIGTELPYRPTSGKRHKWSYLRLPMKVWGDRIGRQGVRW